MAVLTDKGFERPDFNDLVAAQTARAKKIFGDTIDASENSVMGKFIRLLCYDLDNAYQELEQCYYARFPNTASGQSLDRLVAFAAISRNPATPAYHNITFTGTAGAVIPAGFLVSTVNDIQFHTILDLTIESDGTVSGVVEANEAGTSGNVTVGSINTIVNPSANVSAITHTSIDEAGQDIESDIALRKRFTNTLAGGGSSTYASIKSELLRVPNVNSVIIIENDTDSTVEGLPAHSFCCYVDAPDSQDQAIAEAIFRKKPIGITSVGSKSVQVKDDAGDYHTIKFNKVADVAIYCKVTIAKNSNFESSGTEDIKSAIINKINTLSNGNDVIISSLYAPIMGIQGVMDITSLTLSIDGSTYSASNIAITSAQTAKTATDKIIVTVIDYVDQ